MAASSPPPTVTATTVTGVAVAAATIFVLWISAIVWAVKQERLARATAVDHRDLEPATA